MLVVTGFVLLIAAPDSTRYEGFSMCVGAGLALWLLNWLFRIGAAGDRERDDEQAARDYLADARALARREAEAQGLLRPRGELVRAHHAVAPGALGRVKGAVGVVEHRAPPLDPAWTWRRRRTP